MVLGDPPFKVNNSASQEILRVNNNCKITCIGLECKNADITVGQTLPNATIMRTGNITCNAIACTSLPINNNPYIPYTEIIALNNVAATGNFLVLEVQFQDGLIHTQDRVVS